MDQKELCQNVVELWENIESIALLREHCKELFRAIGLSSEELHGFLNSTDRAAQLMTSLLYDLKDCYVNSIDNLE